MPFPIEELREWFLENRRSFPWRENPTPYRVWISEVMLQQTQAAVVVAYFEKWMQRFPTIEALAEASSLDVIKLWEGLGYYSRALNLHAGAIEIVKKWGGKIPATKKELLQIKGIGAYTAGAILSFAFHQKEGAVDGNVIRVLSRLHAILEPVDTTQIRKKIEDLAYEYLPEIRPWEITEALIEFGATLCQKKPRCAHCFLRSNCLGYQKQIAEKIPVKNKKVEITHLLREVAIISFEGFYLIRKGMGELYEFPYFEVSERVENIKEKWEKELNLELTIEKILPEEKHSFTRFVAHLFPIKFITTAKKEGLMWEKNPKRFPFSSGHRRILELL